MAVWSDTANTQIATIARDYNITNADMANLRSSISQWADVIGNFNRKTWEVSRYRITATAQNHEVLTIQIDM